MCNAETAISEASRTPTVHGGLIGIQCSWHIGKLAYSCDMHDVCNTPK